MFMHSVSPQNIGLLTIFCHKKTEFYESKFLEKYSVLEHEI